MTENILAETTIIDDGRRRRFRVEGGLRYIKDNSAPYFTLTCWCGTDRHGWGGANHEAILEHFPEFTDLAALHLADINGQPMHDIANGWYWLEGALGGVGSDYHGGNYMMGWTRENCWTKLQSHLRLTDEALAKMKAEVTSIYDTARDMGLSKGEQRKALKEWISQYCEQQRDRWKAEAEACISAHNLVVYGDKWKTT